MEQILSGSLASPPLLFFILGAAAALVRTDLEIPEQVAKFLSIYLLLAIGFKGGVALSAGDFGIDLWKGLGLALLLACLVPVYTFFVLRRQMSIADAAATAATYGSISAVTFVTATSYLDNAGVPWSGYLVAAMALMESPAIIIGLVMYRLFGPGQRSDDIRASSLFRESFLNGSVFLILGSLVIGWITGYEGKKQLAPFVDGLFIGVLCLFLLDMGILAMRRLRDLRTPGNRGGAGAVRIIIWGLLFPLINAAVALSLGALAGLPVGDAVLLVILSASASYIAVPAAMRLALPEASPGIYLTMSLAITFPFNILVGIPLYHQLVIWLSS